MPPQAIALLLLSAVMHAAWNGWMKGSSSRLAYLWWGQVLAIGLYALPIALTHSLAVPPPVWPVLVGSALCETGYMIAIARAYGLGDMSLVYPLARGSAPAFVTLWSGLWLGERLPWTGYLGIGLLVLGLYLVSLPGAGDLLRPLRAVATPGARWALVAGVFIAGYSTLDKVGVSHMPAPAYTLWTFLAMNLACAPAVLWLEGRANLAATVRYGGWRLLAGGVFVMGAYFLVLGALSIASASYVSAVRGVSILLGAVWGWRFLGERFGPLRLLGAGLMVTGLVTLAVAG